MTNEQIKKDYAKFLETGCDYSDEMFERDQATIQMGNFVSGLCLFAAGLLGGFVLANLVGVV